MIQEIAGPLPQTGEIRALNFGDNNDLVNDVAID